MLVLKLTLILGGMVAVTEATQNHLLQVINTAMNAWMLYKAAQIQAEATSAKHEAATTRRILDSRLEDIDIPHEDRRDA